MNLHTIYQEDFACTHEQEAWLSLRAGNKKALSFIYTKYFEKLYNYGIKITPDAALAEDCIQDLFIELWNKKETLSEVKNVKYYLYKSLRRKIIYKLQLRSRLPEVSGLVSFEIQLSHKSHYLSQQINLEMREKINQLVNSLTPKQKEAIFLIYYEELSYTEVALIMDLKIKTVYNLIHLAISKLKENKKDLSMPIVSYLF